MARHQRDNLTSENFRQAFHQTLHTRVPQLPLHASDRDLILAFENLSDEQRKEFWPTVKQILNCETDWPIKHYSNTFLAAKYTTKLKDCPIAKDTIRNVVCQAVQQPGYNQKEIKKTCYKLLAKYDIFPIQIDNYIYHMVQDLSANPPARPAVTAPAVLPQFRRLPKTEAEPQEPVPTPAQLVVDKTNAVPHPSDLVMSIHILSDLVTEPTQNVVALPSFQQQAFSLFSIPFSNQSAQQ